MHAARAANESLQVMEMPPILTEREVRQVSKKYGPSGDRTPLTTKNIADPQLQQIRVGYEHFPSFKSGASLTPTRAGNRIQLYSASI